MVNEHWLQLQATSCVSPQESQPVLWSFEARHWLLLSGYERPGWHLLPVEVVSSTLSICRLVWPLPWMIWARTSRWPAAAPASASAASPALACYETASLPNPHEPLLPGSEFSSAASSPHSAFTELKRLGSFSGWGLRECWAGLFDLLSRPPKHSPYHQEGCFSVLPFVWSLEQPF